MPLPSRATRRRRSPGAYRVRGRHRSLHAMSSGASYRQNCHEQRPWSQTMNLSPFLLFDGNCAEAMTFYHSSLGGALTLTLVADTPMKVQAPLEHLQKVAFAHLQAGAV